MMYEIRKRGNGDIYRIRYEWLVIGFADKTKSGTELQQFKTLTTAENFCKKHCSEYAQITIREEEFIDDFDSKFMEFAKDFIDKEYCWNKAEYSSSGLYAVYDANGNVTAYRKKPKTHSKTESLEILKQDNRDYFFVPYGAWNQHGTEIIHVSMTPEQMKVEQKKHEGVYFANYTAASYYVND